MGGVDGQRGAWAFVMGGMGAVSDAIAKCAQERGVKMYTNAVCYAVQVYNSISIVTDGH
jgi:phytoene dehydrogenase-like protein